MTQLSVALAMSSAYAGAGDTMTGGMGADTFYGGPATMRQYLQKATTSLVGQVTISSRSKISASQ
jgi:hypothetical protein